jgi:hypothetical protein
VEAALATSKNEQRREYGAKIVFALLTLAFLWSSGGGDPELFWPRQAGLLIFSALGVLLWAKMEAQDIWAAILSKPTALECNTALKWGVGSALLVGGLLTLAVFFLPRSPWIAWDSLQAHAQAPRLVYLPLLLATSYVVEFFLRGYLSESWGKGSVAFLEAVTIGVGLQSSLPFALLLPMIFVWHRLAQTHGIRTAALARVVWTLFIVIVACVVAPYST